MPWEQPAHLQRQISLWTNSKENSYTHLLRRFHLYTSGLLTIYFFIWTDNNTNLERFLKRVRYKTPINWIWIQNIERISILGNEMYIKNNELNTKIFRNKTDRQTFLKINSGHPKSLKVSASHSQILRIKRICSTKKDFDHHSRELKDRCLNQGDKTRNLFVSYHKKLISLQGTTYYKKKIENNKIQNAFY